MLEDEARRDGLGIDVHHSDAGGGYWNLRVGANLAAAKILVDRKRVRSGERGCSGPE